MSEFLMPPALVTVMVIRPYGGVELERFAVPFVFRPMYTNSENVYSIETHREGATIRDILRSAPVDVATWLHRAGVWDGMPDEPIRH